MTEGDKFRLRAEGYDFMDITDHQDLGSIRRALPPTQLPSALPEISVDALGEIVRLTDGACKLFIVHGRRQPGPRPRRLHPDAGRPRQPYLLLDAQLPQLVGCKE